MLWPARLGRFDEAEAREALVVPAADRGVSFDDAGLELACLAAGGSPLELQRLGFAAWSAAGRPGVVDIRDVEAAVRLVNRQDQAKAS
jgi:hypothetical protein